MPEPLRERLLAVIQHLSSDPDVLGILVTGSFVDRTLDEWSDLDLVVVVEAHAWPAILERRVALAAGCGPLLNAFTGEHVGEPRLLVCLFGPPLVHVDLKFLTLKMLTPRVDEPVPLWVRDGRVAAELTPGAGRYPQPDPQWIEDRIWTWVHYAATKIGRGEFLEALSFLAAIRSSVLGPLALARAGATPNGLRRLEERVPTEVARRLTATVSTPERRDLTRALRELVTCYRELRGPGIRRQDGAEREVMRFVEGLERPGTAGETLFDEARPEV